MNISDFIFKNNLYDINTNAYVELFTDGSDFFWNKTPSKVEFINDINYNILHFLNDVRDEQFENLKQYSLYNKLNITDLTFNKIIESDLFKRLNKTYIMDRNFKDLIKVTDDEKTFYYCECNLTDEIFDCLNQIKGKYIIFDNVDNLKKFKTNNNFLIEKEFSCLINYEINCEDEFLF